jgi:predicted dehydrogenase
VSVRLGFAGVGWLGASLADEVPSASGLVVGAVQDADARLASEVAARHGVPWVTGFEALLALPLDAIVISTPNALHAAQALGALEAGYDVLVQKPLATSAPEARRVVATAADLRRVLLVDHTYRFLDTTRALVASLRRIEPVHAVEGVFHNIYGPGRPWSRDPAQAGGGALLDLGVHLIDLALALTRPREVALLASRLGSERGYAVEDAARVELALGGVPCVIEVSWEAPLAQTVISLELAGRGGTLRWENVDGSFYRFRTLLDGVVLLDRESTLRGDTLRAFAAAVRARDTLMPDLRTHDLLDAAYAGARTGRS